MPSSVVVWPRSLSLRLRRRPVGVAEQLLEVARNTTRVRLYTMNFYYTLSADDVGGAGEGTTCACAVSIFLPAENVFWRTMLLNKKEGTNIRGWVWGPTGRR